jgi:hypothetical protein
MRRLPGTAPFLRRLAMAGAVAATLAGIGAAPALADDWGHRGDGWRHGEWRHDGWRRHEWREHEWRERHGFFAPRYYYPPSYYYYPPSYAYVPPPVVYPPAFVAPGLNLGFYFR